MPRPMPARRARRLVVAGALALVTSLGVGTLAGPGLAQAAPAAARQSTDQVVTWGASADRVAGAWTDQTVRNIVHTTTAGSSLRISLSNVFGDRPVTFDSVFVGRSAGGAQVRGGTNRQVTFSRRPTVTIPTGAEVLSDPVPVRVRAGDDLAVSVHVVGASGALTGHNLAQQTSYVSPAGDQAADPSPSAFTLTTPRWHWVDALVVDAPAAVDTVATLGNSITDGFASTVGANRRWPDYLARRLADQPRQRRYGIMNEGISGNQVLADGAG